MAAEKADDRRLIKDIVEKGFSNEQKSFSFHTKPPQPSVLPFPVARHRSHGPHWTSLTNNAGLEDEEDKGEEEDDADNLPIPSSFAAPVQRKKKNNLDFSKWKEVLKGDMKKPESNKPASKITKKKVEVLSDVKENVDEYKNRTESGGNSSNLVSSSGLSNTSSTNGMIVENEIEAPTLMDEIEVISDVKENVDEYKNRTESGGNSSNLVSSSGLSNTKTSCTNGMVVENEIEAPTLMDEIEAENVARLSQMSTNDIAEAQAEMMEKMDPALLEMLKKRGREKLEKKKGVDGKDEGSKRSKQEVPKGDLMPQSEISNKTWNVWSQRVEKIRDMRFALDGSVVRDGVHQDQLNDKKPNSYQYNVEDVTERDILRTEGDPAAMGYTIKEAVALIRSMIPGQRTLALQLLTSVFTKALYNMQGSDGQHMIIISSGDKEIDWQAVWAFALGPEAQMVLSLRNALDDLNKSVYLAAAKAIQSILCCDINDNFFNIAEKVPDYDKFHYTAPIFRKKPEIDGGYLHGGFWKYSAKPSNILPSYYNENSVDDQNEGQPTIKDDIVVSSQDIGAGFIRMEILPRILFLLEDDPLPILEECLLSILIALARHSPTSANAIMRCPEVIESVVKICTRQGALEIHVQIKAIALLKALSQSDKQTCSTFVKHGILQKALWQWYRTPSTLEHWVENGKEHCRLTSALMVEQLRLWRVFIHYGYCLSYFSDIFPSLCSWLSLPRFKYLIENNVLAEFSSVSREAYLVLNALAKRLPILHSVDQLNKRDMTVSNDIVEAWSWSHVIPMVDLAISWLSLENINFLSSGIFDKSFSCIVWVLSAVLHMLYHIFDKIAPVTCTNVPWLPQFAPKIGLEIVNILKSVCLIDQTMVGYSTESNSLVMAFCCMRQQGDFDASLSSISFLQGLIQLASLIDLTIHRARNACPIPPLGFNTSDIGENILKGGSINYAKNDLMRIQNNLMNLVSKENKCMQSREMFGRGGPVPGIGFGWGLLQGGFWSTSMYLAQMDANLILEICDKDFSFTEGNNTYLSNSRKVDLLLMICLLVGPKDRGMLDKALDILLQAPVLRHLNLCMHESLHRIKGYKSFDLQFEDNDFKLFSEVLNCHFNERWLSVKKKPAVKDEASTNNRNGMSPQSNGLETIHEDQEIMEVPEKYTECNSLMVEWAHQRLPLPLHWFLSAICSIGDPKSSGGNVHNVAKSGLFLLLGLESMSYNLEQSSISRVSLVWKLHALSMALHANMDVLEDDKSRVIFETLQELYGQELEKLNCEDSEELLNFKTSIHENYTTFVENVVEQFGAISYGDIVFGRQVALYLHQRVEKPVRLAAWNSLSNTRALELLPPLHKCIAEPKGYLMSTEEDEGMLEAYVNSWSSGALDRAATRESMSFTLALHHISCFVFKINNSEKAKLQQKLARSLLRSYSQKQNQKEMIQRFVRYELSALQDQPYKTEIERRVDLLKVSCEGNSSLLAVLDKIKSGL